MKYLLATLLIVAACHETIDHNVDADIDAPPDMGSAAAMPHEPSPRDVDLEVVVVGASLLVVVAPISLIVPRVRRRRRDLDVTIENKPHFS